LMDLQEEKVKKTAEELRKITGKKFIGLGVDVTKPDQVAKAIEEADETMGKLDLLFNNAGIVLHKDAIDLEKDEWSKVIDVNLNGIFYMAQGFARYLVSKGKGGAIVNTASMSGIIVNYPQRQASYNASKAGVSQLTKSLAVEWIEKDIRVNCISPGYIYTELTSFVKQEYQDLWVDLTPIKRMGKPEELAGAVIYLLSDSASFTTGTELVVDGGFTIV
jgi:sorbose reductase